MEILLVAVMIAIGVGIAATTIAAVVIGQRHPGPEARAKGLVGREQIEAQILNEIALRGAASPEEARRAVQSARGLDVGDFGRIDLRSWVARYADLSGSEDRLRLLESAVATAMETGGEFPLEQYSGLIDISFGLGFHSDALARLREKFGFEYVDWAKNARPREADRGGGGAPLFEKRQEDLSAQLALLGLSPRATRQDIVVAYRRLAAESHPDRFHAVSSEAQQAASDRFREITRAYETLLAAHASD